MKKYIISTANSAFVNGDFKEARELYEKASLDIDEKYFRANIDLCNKYGGLEKTCDSLFGAEKIINKILIFTNLGLSTIDGSTVFIANIVNLFMLISHEVHLLCTNEPARNIIDRLDDPNKLLIHRCSQSDVVSKICLLEEEHEYTNIFVRAFGDSSIWFSNSYSDKIVLYWPLLPDPTDKDKEIYESIDAVAFQTEDLRDYTFNILGEKRSLLIPPIIDYPVEGAPRDNDEGVRISYIGTLRPECFSIELLSVIKEIIELDDQVIFNLAVGKIFYKNSVDKDKINDLIDSLDRHPRVHIEYQISPSRCADILRDSDVGFSLWSPTPENIRQISTKLLEGMSFGVNTICFDTPVHRKLFGEDYKYFINDIADLRSKILDSIHVAKVSRSRYSNKYLMSLFCRDAHVSRLASFYLGNNRAAIDSDVQVFNSQFDKIYGLYINNNELIRLLYLSDMSGINIHLFHGVDGKRELLSEYDKYLRKPLETDWELAKKQKRISIGAFGHLHSFIEIAKDAIDHKYGKILILEADAIIHSNALVNNACFRPENFKVNYLGAGKWGGDIDFIEKNLYRPNKATGTFAIALDRSVLQSCIDEWGRFVEPTDIALQKIVDAHKDECFVHWPNLFIADVTSSSTTFSRSQVDISEKFGWVLSDYKAFSIEVVNDCIRGFRVISDFFLPSARVCIYHRYGKMLCDISDFDQVIECGRFVRKLIFFDVYVKNIEYILE